MPETKNIEDLLRQNADAVEVALVALLARQEGALILPALEHALLGGGKRLRAFLARQSCAIFNVPEAAAMQSATAIEAMHAYSLVHDDLPAMDDDDQRRGKPTVHVKWDEATAVLTGDALQALSFEAVSAIEGDIPASNILALTRGLAKSAGVLGMVDGQARDIAAETATKAQNLDDIQTLQSKKTGALIEWSATAGAVLAGEDQATLQEYAAAIGLAFQIQDDILDIEGDEAKTGKKLQKDMAAGKATFVSLLGLNGAKQQAQELVDQAQDALSVYGEDANALRQVARYIILRDL